MVRTLANAFAMDRLAHAFLLTGVRGVGKTTTARLIARALNCTSSSSSGGRDRFEPCGNCDDCAAISLGNHPDVLEMDAASRTGVDDIRELIDSVRYGPVQGKYKIYIVDEVHMLSVNAFNALLKTLEEPPPHIKFVFATTEVRKVPVTVISRCQRFDLRRVSIDALRTQYEKITKEEGVVVDSMALSLIARAADGSVRDGLSILDQAIGYAGDEPVGVDLVRNMMGLADRAQVFDLFEHVMRGDAAGALTNLRKQYESGADPLVVLEDLLRIVHWLTNLKIEKGPETGEVLPEIEFARGKEVATDLGMSDLTKAWQILLKGHGEAQYTSLPLEAVEMILVRLAHAADLPSPTELVSKIVRDRDANIEADPAQGKIEEQSSLPNKSEEVDAEILDGTQKKHPKNFDELVSLFAEYGEMRLYAYIQDHVRPVSFRVGHIVIKPGPNAPQKLAMTMARHLKEWTGSKWIVEVSNTDGDKTVTERKTEKENLQKVEAAKHPRIQELLESFPESEVTAVRDTSKKSSPVIREGK